MSYKNLEDALRNWQNKFAYYEYELSITASATQKFELKERIKECQEQINRLKQEISRIYNPKIQNYPATSPAISEPVYVSINTPIKEPPKENPYSFSIEKTVDYTRLRDFLAAGKLKEADRQTARILLELADREQEGWLCSQDIEKLPCSVLSEIDRLWFQYSNHLFGFGVQRQIWVDIGGLPDRFDFKVYSKFSDRVGWRRNNDWLKKYDDFTFTLAAPKGHLPSLRFPGVEDGTNCWKTWKESFEYFLSRTETCLY